VEARHFGLKGMLAGLSLLLSPVEAVGMYVGKWCGVGCLFAYDLVNQSDCCDERERRLVDGWW
jgi:hypothetical protein